MARKKILIKTGAKYCRLTFIEEISKSPRTAKFICECGTEKLVNLYDVVNSKVKSCGCLYKRHGAFSKDSSIRKLARAHTSMLQRCYNINNKHYKDYGGRGITVCDRWLLIDNFIEDMSDSWKENLSLERVDNSLSYSKNNCKWATNKEQASNKRSTLKVGGMCLKEYCRVNNLNYSTEKYRFHNSTKYVKE